MRVFVVTILLGVAACGSNGTTVGPTPSAASPNTAPSTTRAPSVTSSVTATSTAPVTTQTTAASTTTAAAPPSTFPKVITFKNLTFHTPSSWDIDAGDGVAYIGVLAGGRGDVALRVETEYRKSIDDAAPEFCSGAPPERANEVRLVEQGTRPVGTRTAEFRLWTATCSAGSVVEEHRAWLLEAEQILIFEQRHEPEVVDVVTTAEVD